MAWKIEPDGKRTELLPNERRFTINEIKTAIGGGFVASFPITGKTTKDWPYTIALFDEDGSPKQMDINESASQIAGFMLLGTVVFCSKKEMFN